MVGVNYYVSELLCDTLNTELEGCHTDKVNEGIRRTVPTAVAKKNTFHQSVANNNDKYGLALRFKH